MSENGEIYNAGKFFTLPPALTAWTNSTSGPLFKESLYLLQFIKVLPPKDFFLEQTKHFFCSKKKLCLPKKVLFCPSKALFLPQKSTGLAQNRTFFCPKKALFTPKKGLLLSQKSRFRHVRYEDIQKISRCGVKHRKNCECCPGHYLSTSGY